ncbi:hypothetical protein [Cedecea colo]|uniref:Uncharacterized protein n=1 Tax=Cedecea colo TaxID=2552946 RepID=A0ABX0VKB0_9ENTR|nr:hypothetical protein [Cedecea colo]NIY47443.1 hypothetical protein [Cedecea colo]
MKWLAVPVNKWLSGGALLLAILITISFFIWPVNPPLPQKFQGIMQMGFYDLMSQRKEIYDASMRSVGNTILTTITSPDDNRFVLKGKLTRLDLDGGKIFFSYTPIYSSTIRSGLMVDGLTDLLLHTDVWMEPLQMKQQPIVVGQNGLIFLYPLQR